jgi:hypothetical protein
MCARVFHQKRAARTEKCGTPLGVNSLPWQPPEPYMRKQETQINPGKAGPKGALAEKPKQKEPSSGAPGTEGNNTRRDFVRLPKDKKTDG